MTDVNTMEEIYSVRDMFTPGLEKMAKKADDFEKKIKSLISTIQKLGAVGASIGSPGSGGYVKGLSRFFQAFQFSGSKIGQTFNNSGPIFDPRINRWRNANGQFAGAQGPSGSGGVGTIISNVLSGLRSVMGVMRGIFDMAIGIKNAIFNWGTAVAGVGVFMAMNQAAQFESYRMNMASLMGSQSLANRQYLRNEQLAKLPGVGYEESFQSFNKLYGAGADSRLAERIIKEFGNLNALAGGGKAEFGNILNAITQLITKGKVSGEEINQQLAEFIPQLKELMIKAFGTADTEELSKQGVTSQDFIMKLLPIMETYARAADGAKNKLENFEGILKRVTISIGNELNNRFLPALSSVADWIDNFVSNGGIKELSDNFFSIFSGKEINKLGNNALTSHFTQATVPQMLGKNNPFGWAMQFVSQGEDGGDKMKRMLSIGAAAFLEIPPIIEKFAKGVNYLFEGVNWLFEEMAKILQAVQQSTLWHLLQLPVSDINTKPILPEDWKTLGFNGGRFGENAERFYQMGQTEPSNREDISKDNSPGGFRWHVAQQTKLQKELVDLQRQQNDMLGQTMLGGGAIRDQAFSQVNLGRLRNGSGGDVRDAVDRLVDAIQRELNGAVSVSQRANPLRR